MRWEEGYFSQADVLLTIDDYWDGMENKKIKTIHVWALHKHLLRVNLFLSFV